MSVCPSQELEKLNVNHLRDFGVVEHSSGIGSKRTIMSSPGCIVGKGD